MSFLSRGRLAGPATAPASGEQTVELARVRNAMIEEIVSGTVDAAVEYRQEHDKWVVVISGNAVLDVDGETVELSRGDWLLLPAGMRHRVLHAETGTQWLAVHVFPDAG